MIRLSQVFILGAATLIAAGGAGRADAYAVPAFSSPGIIPASSPDFAAVDYSAAVTQSGSNYVLSIAAVTNNFGAFNWLNNAYTINNETIQVTAVFTASGSFVNGAFQVYGTVPGCSVNCPGGRSWNGTTGVLLKGSLSAYGVDTTHEALGFNTTGLSGWAVSPASNGTPYGFENSANATDSLWLFSTNANPTGAPPSQNPGTVSASNLEGANNQINTSTGNTNWNTFLAELKGGGSIKPVTLYTIGSLTTVPLPGSALLLIGALAGLGAFARRRCDVIPA